MLLKKILVIDDSALMRRVISDIINESNDYEVAAIAKDGVEGFDLIISNPNLYSAIILDINMPKMNGLELLEKLQKNRIDQTVIVVSTVAKDGAKETIKALEYGAFDFVTKPENYLDTKGDVFKKQIHNMLDLATNSSNSIARTKTVSTPMETNHLKKSEEAAEALNALRRRSTEQNVSTIKVDTTLFTDIKRNETKIVALACSTGGPKSLQQLIPFLPNNLDAGVVIVQHMPKGFTFSLAQRLNEISEIKVKEAEEGDVISKGCVYIAPGGRHLKISKSGASFVIKISDEPAIEGLRPCANVMFKSLEECNYDEITCVVLTGMGSDGTKGIQGLAAAKKNIHVISQNEETCVVYGMPKAIVQVGLVDEIVPLNKVAAAITKNVGVS